MKKGFRLLTVLALSGAMFCWLHASSDATVFADLGMLEQIEIAQSGCTGGGCGGTFCEICEATWRSCYENHDSANSMGVKICVPASGYDCCI